LHRNMLSCSIIWQANPHTATKTFGTPRCVICSRERLEIVKMNIYQPHLLINSRNKIYMEHADTKKLDFIGTKAQPALMKLTEQKES
jgi:hypothetical protein